MADEPTPETSEPDGINIAGEVSETFAKLAGGERWAVLGAAIVLVGLALFDLILDEYRTGHVPFVLAMLVVGAAYLHRAKSREMAIPYSSLIWVAAGLLGVLGVFDLIVELRNGIFDADGATVVGALIYYAGAIMSGVGALTLDK